MSNPFAPPAEPTAEDGRPTRRRTTVRVIVTVVALCTVLLGFGTWALLTHRPGPSTLTAADPALASPEENTEEDTSADASSALHDGLTDPWRRGDLQIGVDGGNFLDPWPMDAPVTSETWTVTLTDPRPATDEILAADPSNQPPYGTNEYWTVHVEATYTGPGEELTPSTTPAVSFLGDDGTSYTMSCGVVPEEFSPIGRISTGETVSGTVCVSVPAGGDGSWNLYQPSSGYVTQRAP